MSAFATMTSVVSSLWSSPLLGRSVARLTLVLMCSSLALTKTRAQGRAEDSAQQAVPPKEAIDHYSRGRAHYQAGRYREAAVELEQARALDPNSPNLVYNLARVYELQGNIDQALANYERYRAMLPADDVVERERASTAIQRLTGARAQAAREKEPTAPALAVRTERGVADGAFWTLASFSLAALVTGAVTGGLALRAERDAQAFVLGRDGDQNALEAKAQRADRLAVTADVTLAIGAVGGLTSILLYALRTRPVIEPRVAIARHGLFLTLGGAL